MARLFRKLGGALALRDILLLNFRACWIQKASLIYLSVEIGIIVTEVISDSKIQRHIYQIYIPDVASRIGGPY